MDNIINKLRGKSNRIAVMGGTFDPIHYGHLVTAETVRVQYGFDMVIFIPSGDPPHKRDISITQGNHRYIMVSMAVHSNPFFEVSRMEIDREGSTYTVDTIRELRYGLSNDTEIFFITGADAILEILTWKNPEELFSMCSFIAVTRPGYGRDLLTEKVKELKKSFKCHIDVIDVPAFAISSTEIRKRVGVGDSIKYLVPEDVELYILKNNLYRVPGEYHDG